MKKLLPRLYDSTSGSIRYQNSKVASVQYSEYLKRELARYYADISVANTWSVPLFRAAFPRVVGHHRINDKKDHGHK